MRPMHEVMALASVLDQMGAISDDAFRTLVYLLWNELRQDRVGVAVESVELAHGAGLSPERARRTLIELADTQHVEFVPPSAWRVGPKARSGPE